MKKMHLPKFKNDIKDRFKGEKEKFVKVKARLSRALIYVLLILLTLPIIWFYLCLGVQSFSGKTLYGFIPVSLTLKNWRFLWQPQTYEGFPNIWMVTLNTLFLAIGVMALTITISTMCAYIISRYNFRGKEFILKGSLIIRGFPSITLLVGVFYLLWKLKLINTLSGVILVKVGFELPFQIWIMKGFFDGVPWDIEMAALMDGATRFQTWYKVLLPLVKPGILALSLLAFLSGWSEFIYTFSFIFQDIKWTLSLYAVGLIGQSRFVDYGLLTAVSVFFMIPVIVIFSVGQKYLLQLTIAGTKGK